MGKIVIDGRQLMQDIKAGITDIALMEKYKLSAKGLQSLFRKMVLAGVVSQFDLDRRMPWTEKTVEIELFRCPACSLPQLNRFDECPQCGIIVNKYRGATEKEPPAPTPLIQASSKQPKSEPPQESRPAAPTRGSTTSVGHRADPQRTGFYPGPSVKELTELKWKVRTSGWVSCTPAVINEQVCFGSLDGNLYVVDVETGEDHKRIPVGASIHSSCGIIGSAVVFGCLDGALYIVDLSAGRITGKFNAAGPIYSSPAIHEKCAYFGSLDNHLYAVDLNRLTLKWKFKTAGEIYCSPALMDDVITFGSLDGHVYTLDRETGREVWRFRANAIVNTTPVLTKNAVLFGSGAGTAYSLNRQGEEQWTFKAGDKITTSPAISTAKNLVCFGSSDKSVYALDLHTGEELWRFETGGAVNSSPSVAENAVYFGSGDRHFYAVNLTTGKELWRFKTGSPIYSSPCIVNGVIYFGSDDSCAYALA